MNKWQLNLLKEIINIKEIYNISEDTIYDYLRIVDLNKIKYEKKANNTLFFLTYSTKSDLENKFLIKSFDYRKKANEIINNNLSYSYVMDKETFESLSSENRKAKILIVDDIIKAIDSLYRYILNNRVVKVIGVTGSVGKTTSVGLIENVLKTEYNVLRIYSKRITPIILKANIINFLTESIDYAVLEMSIYRKDHVEILSDLLKPDIAALINVDSSHLEFFKDIDDICKCKSSIFRYASVGFVNNLDNRINKLDIKDGILFWDKEKIYNCILNELCPIAIGYEMNEEGLYINNQKVKLFYSSELSLIQTLLAYKIGVYCNINEEKIINAINSYVPVENRIQKQMIFGKEAIFDGDITTHERIKQLSKHNYLESYLVIRKFGSAENNKRFEKVLKSFDAFTKIYVFDDIEYLSMLSSHPKVQLVSNHDFMDKLNGKIIYHYSGYYRSFKEFNENNLIELENEIYKIMKPEV